MANRSLCSKAFAINDVTSLSSLFEISFDYYIAKDTASFPDYLNKLRTLAGLCFSAILADRTLISTAKGYLDIFIERNVGDFKINPSNKSLIANSLAELIGTAELCFRVLHYPDYYLCFLQRFVEVMSVIPLKLSGREKDISDILSHFNIK